MIAVPRWGVALVLAIFAGGLALGSVVGLATSTETRYAEMGREMAASGDLVVPRFDGAPRLEKPPFDTWTVAAAIAVLGATDVAARLPHLLAGLLTLLVAAAAARRLSSSAGDARERARLAFLAIGTMPAFAVQAYTVSTDVWLVLATTLAGWALLECDREAGKPPLRFVLLLHVALGFGMLVKGPLPIGLVLGAAAVTAAIRRDARILRPFGHPTGIAAFLAVSLPWYALVEQRLPGTLSALAKRRLLGTFTGHEVGHAHGPLAVWGPLVGSFPWLALVPASVRSLRAEGRWTRGPGLPIAALALAAPVLFTFSANRLPSYASPAIPWIGLLVAVGLPASEPSRDSTRRTLSRAAAIVAGLAVLIPIVGAVALSRGRLVPVSPMLALALAAGATVLAVVLLARGAPSRSASSAALAAGALLFSLGAAATVLGERLHAGKPLATALASARRPGQPVAVWLNANGDWGLLPFYLGEEVVFFDFPSDPLVVRPEAHRPDLFRPASDVVPWLRAHPRAWLLLRPKDADALERQDVRLRVLLRHGDDEIAQELGGIPGSR